MNSKYFDKRGEPITSIEWSYLFGDPKYKRVALHTIDRQYNIYETSDLECTQDDHGIISTVWLGIDHGYDGRLQIFETLVQTPASPSESMERYSTLEEATVGHQRFIDELLRNFHGRLINLNDINNAILIWTWGEDAIFIDKIPLGDNNENKKTKKDRSTD